MNILNRNFLLIFISFTIVFILNFSAKSNDFEDWTKIGTYKEKLTYIYSDYLSVIDISTQIDEIIIGLEENTIDKKEAMTEGLGIINELKKLISDTTVSLNNLEPLVLSSENKVTENLYREFVNFLKNEIEPTMSNEVNMYETAFLNALIGEFEDPLTRYIESFDRIKLVISSENKLLKLNMNSYEDDEPTKNKTKLIYISNIYIIDYLDAFVYLFKSSLRPEDENISAEELLEFFSNTNTILTKSINEAEREYIKGIKNLENFKKIYTNQEFNEQTQIWVDEVLNLMDEAFAIEKEVINSLKKSMQYFTLNNFAENENVFNDILESFNEIYYYSILREELSVKESNALKKMEALN